jgi:predicted transposase YbfD/YdcC
LLHDSPITQDSGHGRLERRQYWTIADPEVIAYLNAKEAWAGLRSVGMVEAERQVGEQVSRERRYYLTSLPGNAQAFGEAVRSHWNVENGLHWVLDLAFQEDASRMRHPITANRTLWCCGIWPSICSNRNPRPSVASKPGDSKPDGVKTISARFLPLKI